jgi:biotin transport system substrate-specific component
MASRTPFVTYDSTLLDHMGVGAASSAARTSMRLAAMLFLTTLTAAAAQVSVHLPFTPVPATLQPMVVLVGAAALGGRLGASSQVLYLLLGVAGLPVFAASPILPQGLGRLFGPTGGYLLAYPIAAFVAGTLAERGFDRRYFTSVIAMIAGLGTLFLGGVLWLAFVALGPGGTVGVTAALETGFYPFVVQNVVQVCVAGGLLPMVWKLLAPSQDS